MSRTCHQCHGHSNDYHKANLKCCSGCQKVFYCSAACQKCDWITHIFDCKPNRAITTADHLALAVHKRLFPEHPQTREDYGFNHVVASQENVNLFSLYFALFKVLQIPSKTVHEWRVRGVLVSEIKAAFDTLPRLSKTKSFSWFLENQDVIGLAGQPLSKEEWQRGDDALMTNAWQFIGGSERESPEEICAAIEQKPEPIRQCFWMYHHLLAQIYPFPGNDDWIAFGFASCACGDEKLLGYQYLRLVKRCTFEAFCNAYRERRMLELFHSKGLQVVHDAHFCDILHGPADGIKSVWYFKRYLALDGTDFWERMEIHSTVKVDYGFANCQNDAEKRQLRRVYKAFFEDPRGNSRCGVTCTVLFQRR